MRQRMQSTRATATGRRLRRSAAVLLTMSLALVGLALPAGAEVTIEDMVDGIKQEFAQNSADAQAFLNNLGPEAEGRLQEIRAAAARRDWAEVKRLSDQLKVDAECRAFEFDINYLPNSENFSSLRIDKARRVAIAEVTVPAGCHLSKAVPVTMVTWVLDASQKWGTSPQGRKDITDTVWVKDPGTYVLEAAMPTPNLDGNAIRATLERDGVGFLAADENGDSPLGAAALDIDGIIDAFLSNPELLDLVLGLICPFQVDVVTAEAQDVPTQLGGVGGGDPVTDADSVSVSTLMHGMVGEWDSARQYSPVPDPTGGRISFDTSYDDPLQQAAAADPEVAGTLAEIPFELLCAEDPEGPEVLPTQVTNTGTDSGTEVAGATTLPRTGSETPGVLATGLALILAGWLVLVTNAFLRSRSRRSLRTNV